MDSQTNKCVHHRTSWTTNNTVWKKNQCVHHRASWMDKHDWRSWLQNRKCLTLATEWEVMNYKKQSCLKWEKVKEAKEDRERDGKTNVQDITSLSLQETKEVARDCYKWRQSHRGHQRLFLTRWHKVTRLCLLYKLTMSVNRITCMSTKIEKWQAKQRIYFASDLHNLIQF